MSTNYLFIETSQVLAPTPIESVWLTNDGFCPDIDLTNFETKYQLDQTYGFERRKTCLVEAMQVVNDSLAEQVCVWTRAGWGSLAAVPSAEANGESTKLNNYRQAVYCYAMHLLAGRYRATDTKDYAVPKAAAMEEAATYWHGQYITALQRLLGHGFMELI